MEKILKDLKAAMEAEKQITPALSVATHLFEQLVIRLTEHKIQANNIAQAAAAAKAAEVAAAPAPAPKPAAPLSTIN